MSETTNSESPPLANRPRLESIPPLLASVRDYLQEVLPLMLRAMFEKTDDALFELAEKAEIAAEQKIYFNAKKEIRLKRKKVEVDYLAAMREVFHLEPEIATSDKQSSAEKILGSSSIEDPMFRVWAALDEMVDRVNHVFEELLERVAEQINVLLPQYKLDQHNCPLSISILAENFLLACNCLNIETEEKIILLNAFEKCIVEDFGKVLNRAHRLLLDGEIANLANIKQQTTEDVNSDKNKKNIDFILDKANEDKNKKQKLLSELFDYQKEALLQDNQIHFKQIADTVKEIARDLPIEADSVLGKELQQAIDLMRMLFDFMLMENESDDLAHWLAKLYLPLLRALLIDVTVLSSEGHAVRRLLNEIAKTAIDVKSGTSEENDLYRRHINKVVARIAKEFDQDLAIFPELLVDFKSVIDDERRRQKIISDRMREINSSPDKLDKAAAEIDKKIARLCKNKQVPIVIDEFLNQHWKTVLLLLYLKEGEKSVDFNKAVNVTEFVVESASQENKHALVEQLPDFLQEISRAMESVGSTSAEIIQFFNDLESLHLQQYKKARERAEKRLANKPTVIPETPAANEDEESLFESVVPDELVNEVAAETEPEQLIDTKEERRAHAQQCVSELKADMWLEFYPEPDKKIRVKIATILKPSQKFIFVDRDGKKIMEKNVDEMVDAIEQDILKLLDADSVFGKALAIKH